MSRPGLGLLRCLAVSLAMLWPALAAADLDAALRAFEAGHHAEAEAEAEAALNAGLGPDDALTARQVAGLARYEEGHAGTAFLAELEALDRDMAEAWGHDAVERVETLFAIADLAHRLGRRDTATAGYVEIARLARLEGAAGEDLLWALGNLAGLQDAGDARTRLRFAGLFEFFATDLLGPTAPMAMEATALVALALVEAGETARAAHRYFRHDPQVWDDYAGLGPWEGELVDRLIAALDPHFREEDPELTAAIEAVFDADAARQALAEEIAQRVEDGGLNFGSAAYGEAVAGMNRYLDRAEADDPLIATFSGMILRGHLERGDFSDSRPYLATVLTYPPSYLALMDVPLPLITAVAARTGGTEDALLEAMILKSLEMEAFGATADPELRFDLRFALGEVRESLGRDEAALEAYGEALAMREAHGGGYRLTELLSRMGAVLSGLGRHEEAERVHLRMLETARTEDNEDAASSALLSLALGAVALDRPEDALARAREGMALAEGDADLAEVDRVRAAMKLATVIAAVESGITPEFAALVEEVVAVPRETLDPESVDVRDRLMVEFSRRLGPPEAVRDHPAFAGYGPEQVATLAAIRAEIAVADDAFAEALDWVAFGDETAAASGEARFRLREVEGQVALAEGRAADALLSFRAITDHGIGAEAREVPGALAHLPLHMAAAQPLAEDPETGADLWFQNEMFLLAQLASQTAASAALNVTLARDMAEGEAGSLLRRRAALAREIARLGSALDRAAVDFKAPEEIAAERETLAQELRGVNVALREAAPDLASMAALNPLRMEEVAARLEPDEVLAIYVTSDMAGFERQPASFLVALSRETVFVTRLPARADLTELGHALRCSAALTDPHCGGGSVSGLRGSFSMEPQPEERGPAFDSDLAHRAYQTLVAPMEQLLAGKSRLVIVADRALVALPFHLMLREPLPAGAALTEGRWLIRDFSVEIAPSVQGLVRGRETEGAGGTGGGFLGIGDPLIGVQRNGAVQLDCGEDSLRPMQVASAAPEALKRSGGPVRIDLISDLAALPDARCELRATARLFARSELLLHEAATESKLKRMSEAGALRDFSVLSFATHGLIAGEIGVNDSGLVLTPPRVATARDDGLLTTAEIAGLDLDAEFVILSACNTASGDSVNDEALSGLATAFFVAGARSLVVSHWPVYSDAAVEITTRMFDELRAEPGLSRAEALRRSMLALLEDPGASPRQAHPSYWGPFMLVGGGRGM